MVVWLVLATIIRHLEWTLPAGVIVNVITFAVCVPLMRPYMLVKKMPPIDRRWYDIPLRAGLVATLVATVVTTSSWVGPKISGIIALFPIVFTSLMLILHPRIGGPATSALFAHTLGGLVGMVLAFVLIYFTIERIGAAAALSAGLAVTIAWNLMLIALRSLTRPAAARSASRPVPRVPPPTRQPQRGQPVLPLPQKPPRRSTAR